MTITDNHGSKLGYTQIHHTLAESICLRDIHLSNKCGRSDRRQIQRLAHNIANKLAGPLAADDPRQLLGKLVPLARRCELKYLAPLIPVAAFAKADNCLRACLDFGLPLDGLVLFGDGEGRPYADTLTILWTWYVQCSEPVEKARVIGLATLLLDAGGNSDEQESGLLWSIGYQPTGEMLRGLFNESEFLGRLKATRERRMLDEITMAAFNGGTNNSNSVRNTVVHRL